MSEVKAQLAALAARQSGGKTSDPAALSVPSAINARVPAVPDIDTSKKSAAAGASGGKGKAKGKTSSKQMKRAEKAKERATELNLQLEKKLREKEGRKVSCEQSETQCPLERSESIAPQATSPEDSSRGRRPRIRVCSSEARQRRRLRVRRTLSLCLSEPGVGRASVLFFLFEAAAVRSSVTVFSSRARSNVFPSVA
ncbi:hypothetical protein QFC22_003494 [Naganishia vaughanmartiniae]|uniref:Uncharacterized protein n=1 Tax=Naganishia vaughanmartiniae TaxID=1424756 RepID=A0ACC2X4R1_9TREE|nr:hypothetical protein QFC22_003494 [Naganishia vaughanmartiniae]